MSAGLSTLLSFPAQEPADILPALSELDDSIDVGHKRAISVDRVVAWAWNPGRLERAARLLAVGVREFAR